MSKTCTPVAPDAIRFLWPQLRPWVKRVCAIENQHFLPEDIYTACVTGRAVLYVGRSDATGEITGYVVLEKRRNWGLDELWVLHCYHDEPGVTIKDYWPWLVEQARAAGCTRICIESPRAYHKVLPVKLTSRIFEYEIEP